MTSFELRLEIDVTPSDRERYSEGFTWVGDGDYAGISVEVLPTQGHGFGLTEIVDIAVNYGVPLAMGVAGNLLTDAIKAAVRGTIRRANVHRDAGRTGAPVPEEDETFDMVATGIDQAVARAIDEAAE